jgi:hypothetical protein
MFRLFGNGGVNLEMQTGSIDKIIRPKDGKEFKIGDLVYWADPDWNFEDQEYQKKYESNVFTGNIENIMVIQYDWNKEGLFNIEITLTNTSPYDLGRLELNDIELDPEDLRDEMFYSDEYWNEENKLVSTESNNEGLI